MRSDEQPTLEQCPLSYVCNQQWESLEPVRGQDDIKFCLKCQRSVYFCRTPEDLARNAPLGRCLAVLDAARAKQWVFPDPKMRDRIDGA